ncbi:MAG: FtsX-like permease family protein, partial [Bacteroidota bacterium]
VSNLFLHSTQTFFMCFDEKMLDTYSIPLTAGKNFSGNIANDSTKVMLNQKAASLIGIDNAEIVGSQLYFTGVDYPFTIIGVLEDFHFQSLHEDIAPLVVGAWSNPVRAIDYFSLKLKSGSDLAKVIKATNKVHETFDNQTAMEYHLLDQQLQLFYDADQRAGQIFTLGAGLTVFIACLGLFGLASFMVRKKTKEVSIRKVLGATSGQLFILLSKTFFIQILIASLIAAPVSWYMMSGWLDYFAYRIDLNVVIYLVAGIIALIVALFTTSYHSIKAAKLNPASALKAE